jgi:hypothetical protein
LALSAGAARRTGAAAHATPKPSAPIELRILGESSTFTRAVPISGVPEGALALFQSFRYGGDFHYVLENLPPHQRVRVELAFAELTAEAPGQRLMRIEINGQPVLDHFDVVAQAGGARRALVRPFDVDAGDRLDIHFIGLQGHAFVNFVRVSGLGAEIVIGPGASQLVPHGGWAPYDLSSSEIEVDADHAAPPFAMPIGGIGTGSFDVLPDGSFSDFTIGNSWAQPVAPLAGTFLAVRAKQRSFEGDARVLRVGSRLPAYSNATPMPAARYRARYPFAELDFTDPSFPLEVRLEAFAPCVPFDLPSSSLPVAVIFVEVRNPKNYPVASAVAFSWENFIGRGGGGDPSDTFPASPSLVHNDAGSAGIVGIQFSSLEARMGRRATFLGDQFVGAVTTGVVVTRLLHWDPSDSAIPWWKDFIRTGRLARKPDAAEFWSASSPAGGGTHAAVVCATFNLAPRETRRLPFLVSWFYPGMVERDGVTVRTNASAQRFASSVGVAFEALDHLDYLETQSRAWRDGLLASDLPRWFSHALLNASARAAANSLYTDAGGVQWIASAGNGPLRPLPAALELPCTAWPRSFWPEVEQQQSARLEAALARAAAPQLSVETPSAWATHALALSAQSGTDAKLEDRYRLALGAMEKLLAEPVLDTPSPEGTFFADWPTSLTADLRPYKLAHAAAAMRAIALMAARLGDDKGARVGARQAADLEMQAYHAFESATESTTTSISFAPTWAGDWTLRAGAGRGILDDRITSLVRTIASRHLLADTVVTMEVPAARGTVSAPMLLYPWLAAEALRVGLPNAGFELAARTVRADPAGTANPWGPALFVDSATGKPVGEPNHTAQASLWTVLDAIVGVRYEVPTQTLWVLPSLPFELGDHVFLPFFTPAFYGELEYDSREETWDLRVMRTAAADAPTTLTVRRVVVRDRDAASGRRVVNVDPPLELHPGSQVGYRAGRCTDSSFP